VGFEVAGEVGMVGWTGGIVGFGIGVSVAVGFEDIGVIVGYGVGKLVAVGSAVGFGVTIGVTTGTGVVASLLDEIT
jgi:hypothetical protein